MTDCGLTVDQTEVARKKDQPGFRHMGRASSIGIEFALLVVVFLLIGAWADSKLGCGPWLMLLGIVIGSGAGFRALFQVAKSMEDG